MPKVERLTDQSGESVCWYFECPACRIGHSPHTQRGPEGGPRWTFNGDVEKPTFAPSLLVRWEKGPDHVPQVCHSFIRDGMIEFLGDCTHELAGKTVPLGDIVD